ncbi:MAG TPA: ABC transporter ATP-binding protein [Chloroflexia bacterium]|nr:ABC transporter ATP-binding protein [Chloroflexia bacterium]
MLTLQSAGDLLPQALFLFGSNRMDTISKIVPIEVHVQNVSKSFPVEGGRSVQALQNLDLDVQAGSFVSILGPSGSGKSTLLGILAGLDKQDSGAVSLRTPDGSLPSSSHAAIGYMPQHDLLLPWRNALDNATVGLEVAGTARAVARARVLPLFREFGLEGFSASYPNELSGGMRQRVSFLRSAVLERGLMLLDEPFGALDALTRASMHEWLLAAAQRMGSTFILVTHDVEEAILLSDKVYILSPRPGTVVAGVDIDLPAPRSLATLEDERFAVYRRSLLDTLRATGGLVVTGARAR